MSTTSATEIFIPPKKILDKSESFFYIGNYRNDISFLNAIANYDEKAIKY
jgi:hypothetical protein